MMASGGGGGGGGAAGGGDHAVPFVIEIVSGANLPVLDTLAGSSDPYVNVSLVSAGGQRKGVERRTIVKYNTLSPVWRAYLDFGVAEAEVEPTDELHLQVLDKDLLSGDDHMGCLRITVAFLTEEEARYQLQEKAKTPSEAMPDLAAGQQHGRPGQGWLSVRRVPQPRGSPTLVRIFMVRHGESTWNVAQENSNLVGMLGDVDHPLSAPGIQQCRDLRARLAAQQEASAALKTAAQVVPEPEPVHAAATAAASDAVESHELASVAFDPDSPRASSAIEEMREMFSSSLQRLQTKPESKPVVALPSPQLKVPDLAIEADQEPLQLSADDDDDDDDDDGGGGGDDVDDAVTEADDDDDGKMESIHNGLEALVSGAASRFTCEFRCGFEGSFETVSKHERSCSCRPPTPVPPPITCPAAETPAATTASSPTVPVPEAVPPARALGAGPPHELNMLGDLLGTAEDDWWQAEAVYTSPLRRAVQTCLLVARGHSALQRKLTLLASAREVKSIGGRDTIGQSSGADVVDGALKDLERTAWKLGLSHPNELEPFDAADLWWTPGVNSDDAQAVNLRFESFLGALRYHVPGRCKLIVVTHSNFIRAFCARYTTAQARVRAPLLEKLATSRLANATVVALDISFASPDDTSQCGGIDAAVLVSATPVFGTHFADEPSSQAQAHEEAAAGTLQTAQQPEYRANARASGSLQPSHARAAQKLNRKGGGCLACCGGSPHVD
jgi:broad specificity phosphatase PhoE